MQSENPSRWIFTGSKERTSETRARFCKDVIGKHVARTTQPTGQENTEQHKQRRVAAGSKRATDEIAVNRTRYIIVSAFEVL